MNAKSMASLLWLSIISVGCSNGIPEDSPSPRRTENPSSRTQALRPSVPGYSHDPAKSKFAIGAVSKETVDSDGVKRTVGEHGVIAFNASNGGFWAVPNADAPSESKSSLFRSGEEHNAFTRQYFTSVGLPDNQIQRIRTHTSFYNSGKIEDAVHGTDVRFSKRIRYTSVLVREVSGAIVPDSYAWATFDADGEATAEQIYWPELPMDVVAAAGQLISSRQKVLQTAKAVLGVSEDLTGEVVIHHSGWRDKNPWFNTTIDVVKKVNGASTIVHIGADGSALALPYESATEPADNGSGIENKGAR